jgi:integrase
MTKLRLRYVQRFRDQGGQVRHYFRRPGSKTVPLPGLPGSAEFMAAYHAALAGEGPRVEIGASRSHPGTVSAAVAAYYGDNSFLALAPGTRKARRAILEKFRAEHGDKRLALLQRAHVVGLLGAKPPFAARNWLKTLRGLMQFAVAMELRGDDPTNGIHGPKARAGTIHSWTEAEIAQYEARHPIGSRPRVAQALLLYTAQRRGDVVRLGRQHMRDGVIALRQEKTGAVLEIPVHPTLAAILAATATDHLTFLTTATGAPFSSAGFGNVFRQWCTEAGLPALCSSHGLRKAACRRLAEAGCSEHEIAAISGHESLSEVRRYTKAASQARMARSAMATVTRAFPERGEG